MTSTDSPEMQELEDVFELATREEIRVPDRLILQVLADADAAQVKQAPESEQTTGIVAWFAACFGGWPAFGGLAAATCAGFWIGFSPPVGTLDHEIIPNNEETSVSDEDGTALSGFGWDLEEG